MSAEGRMTQRNVVGPEAAKATVREYFQRLLNEHDLSVCDAMLSGDYVDHDAPPDTPPGPESIREYLAGLLEEYPDMHVEMADILAEGSRVAARLVWRGSHRASGEVFHQMGIVILRLDERGRLAERWSAYRSLA
jgi:predicted SnoaL-like aldol condensation-catalyzing enzyme